MRRRVVLGGLLAGACSVVAAAAACVPSYDFVSESDAGPGGIDGASDAPRPPSPDGGGPTDGSGGMDVLPGSDAPPPPPGDAGGPFFFETGTPNCFEIAQPADFGTTHIPEGTLPDGGWSSNPPASGSHYPVWASWQDYTTPVPYGYLIHDMEHGGVVFFYRCPPGAPCADVQAALAAAKASLPADPMCTPDAGGSGVRARAVIEPSASMDVLIAVSAWDWQYRANCIDQASLNAFAQAHYGQGPEARCDNGTTSFVTMDAGF